MNVTTGQQCRKQLQVGQKKYDYYSLKEAGNKGLKNIARMPKSLKVLLENLVRHDNGTTVTWDDIKSIDQWVVDTQNKKTNDREISFHPARVLMQDFTGVPAVVDLAAMREAMVQLGGDPELINPLSPVDLVIDHSVNVDHFGSPDAFRKNVELEYQRNSERYNFLKWGQKAFKDFRVVPPGTGIVHQVNLEYLAKVVWSKTVHGAEVVYPDTLVGTDSHTTMINGLAVLGWGVGGIEAEAAMLGQPVTMLIPEVIGMRLVGKLPEGATATDLVLTVTEILRKKGVVNKFVEFFGPGMRELSLADRATLANMAPEYGATCGFFPVDEKTLEYLRLSGRPEELIKLVETYSKEQGLWASADDDMVFTDVLELNLDTIVPSLAGPKRPQDRVALTNTKKEFKKHLTESFKSTEGKNAAVSGKNYKLTNGDVVIAAITSCTNTSNPSVLVAAGLVAKKARAKGLSVKPWVKTSLAPGSKVVTDYLVESGLQQYLDECGFNLVGYGCTTCIGNSGPLPTEISDAVKAEDLVVCSVLSGNRNFEGRVNPDVKANYLASPPLVVAYALAGSMLSDLTTEPLGKDQHGKDVFLKDIWPTQAEIQDVMHKHISSQMYLKRYSNVFEGDDLWRAIPTKESKLYAWDKASTYIQNPPYFKDLANSNRSEFSVKKARILALFGDSVTTDHISPAGDIAKNSPAARYLDSHGVSKVDYNSYGSRRGNHEVMMRGTFANIRIKNESVPGTEGGVAKHYPTGEVASIYDVAMKYAESKTPLIVIGGKEYGTGSSRDWAAKGTILLGVQAVIVESFERIHRSNLIGMGVLPLQFPENVTRKTLGLTGEEELSLECLGELAPKAKFRLSIKKVSGEVSTLDLQGRIDTLDELNYFKNLGILTYVLKNIRQQAK